MSYSNRKSSSFFVYMVRASTGKLYTGVSTDPVRRCQEHNSKKCGAKCLRGQRPVKLEWVSKQSMSQGKALQLEQEIKALSKADKELLLCFAPTLKVADED